MPGPNEWDVDFELVSPAGTLLFNQPQAVGTDTGSGVFRLIPQKCGAATKPRVEKRDVPQGDGSILQRRFETGVEMELACQFMLSDDSPACHGDARCMGDLLDLHLRSLLNAEGLYRFRWQPTGYGDQRMIDQIRLMDWAPPTLEDGVVEQTWTFDTPFPYAIDSTQQEIDVPDGGSVFITNEGTTDFYPVIKIMGPATACTIVNYATGLLVDYDSTLLSPALTVGGGEYLELDHYKNTAVLKPGLDNYLGAINIPISNFFPIVPGPNEITATGADIVVLYNNPWW